ncbi:hypothetical protein AB0M54_40815 [Actinoplanes sp. NPDC051470]|uniref:hypothetical protein n=1 Tax=unclassified Actinoplanes TaxID=2626549 RepID=UPI003448B420
MLFRQDALDRIRDGRVSVVFRRWERARVRAGSRLRTMIGVVEVRAVSVIKRISAADARAAGYPNARSALADLPQKAGDVYRIEVAYAGDDPRVALRETADLPDDEWATLITRLDRMDTTGARGPWTRRVLAVIATHPGTRAGDLWSDLGYPDMLTFKRDVRRLKELGLTESLPVGYRLSPRGAAAWARMPESRSPNP